MSNPVQAVVHSSADAITHVGVMMEHIRQSLAADNDDASKALHRQAAVKHAKAAANLLASSHELLSGFIEANEEKPLIQRT